MEMLFSTSTCHKKNNQMHADQSRPLFPDSTIPYLLQTQMASLWASCHEGTGVGKERGEAIRVPKRAYLQATDWLKSILNCTPKGFKKPYILVPHLYTCQLFLRYRREIFILGVLGFLKTTRSFPRIPEEIQSLPKKSEVFHKIRYREESIVIYSFYTWFSFLTWVWVNIFLEIVSSKTATTHIFQSGVRNWPIFQSGMRNWPSGVSRREIEVFNP